MEVATLFSLPVPTTILYSPRPCLFHPPPPPLTFHPLFVFPALTFSSLYISLTPKFLSLTHLKFLVSSSLIQPFLSSFLSSFLFQFLSSSNFHIYPYLIILFSIFLPSNFSFFCSPSSMLPHLLFISAISFLIHLNSHTSPLTFLCVCE